MKINIISDLHCRSKSFPPSFDTSKLEDADVLVVAGDLAVFPTYEKMLDKLKSETDGKFKKVMSVRGNHDYYVTDYHWLKKNTPESPSDSEISVEHVDDVAFICSPMWSPISNDEAITATINDYNYIPGFTTEKCTELFWKNLGCIEDEVRKAKSDGKKTVVVTHHLPISELIDQKYAGDPINEAFCVINTEAEKRIKEIKPDLWIHGHSHNFLDTVIDGVRYVRNPYGYEWGSHDYGCLEKEDTGFRMNYIIEV